MSATLEQLKQKNEELKLKKRRLDAKVKLYTFLMWIRDDVRIKKIRKELYGTSN
jgi:hypothetical protein